MLTGYKSRRIINHMKDKLPFPNPPITEAVLDIRVELPTDIDLASLAKFHEAILERFPNKEERFSWKSGFQFKKGAAPEILQASGGADGYLFKSVDGKKIVQARLDGFSFNKLKPYERWETLRDEAKELWALYITIAKPVAITRLALRYINKIDIPLPLKDFKEYILTLPEVAKGLPDVFRGYFMTIEMLDPKADLCATIIEALKPIPVDSKSLPLILDIDTYKNIRLKPDDGSLWLIMEQLRDFKNRIFLESLTPKTKEMFK